MQIQSILTALDPRTSGAWGYFLYIIIVLAIVTLSMQKRSDVQITLFMTIPIMGALIDKVAVNPASTGMFAQTAIAPYLMRILMAVFPFVTAGMTKWEKSRLPAILCGLTALTYMFMRWFFEQRSS